MRLMKQSKQKALEEAIREIIKLPYGNPSLRNQSEFFMPLVKKILEERGLLYSFTMEELIEALDIVLKEKEINEIRPFQLLVKMMFRD